MAQDDGIKIRTLPRKNEKKQEVPAEPAKTKPSTPRWIIYVGTTSSILLAAVLFLQSPEQKAKTAVVEKVMSSIAVHESNEAVTRHLQESHMRREMMEQSQQLENLKARTTGLEVDPYIIDPTRIYGVQLDQEDASDRVFEDLNINAKNYGNSTVDEKIKSRMVTREWVNEVERRERITFVRNFIRSAYDRGYEVELDQNLVVVNVRKITQPKKLNIDQIIDKLAAKRDF